jgi:response regulator of citrate/malate metabolism
MNVLIVEDEFLIAMDLMDTVEEHGYTPIGYARSAQEAMEFAGSAEIALVDVYLNDGPTGPQIGRTLTEEFGVSVVFMTGNPEAVIDQYTGGVGVVTKPYSVEQIVEALEYAAHVRSNRTPRETRFLQPLALP